MATKQQVIDSITDLLQQTGTKVSLEEAEILEKQSLAWLQDYYQTVYQQAQQKRKDNEIMKTLEQVRTAAQNEVNQKYADHDRAQQAESAKFYRDLALSQIARVVIRGKKVVMNDATAKIIESWLQFDEVLNVGTFLKILNEQPDLASQVPWVSAKFDQGKADRDLFEQCARLYGYSVNDANWSLVRSTLPQGFTRYDLEQAIRTDDLRLSPPSEQELQAWQQDSIQDRQQELLKMDPNQLRSAARQESSDQRTQQAVTQANESFEAVRQREAASGFPLLPQDLTKQQILSAPTERLKYWLKKFGQSQIDARLQGRG